MKEAIEDMLIRHEDLRLKPYRCSAGKLTIGVGRNLDDNGISQREAMILLTHDVQNTIHCLTSNLPFFEHLDGVRQMALIDMCFNLGINGLLNFKRMLKALRDSDFEEAAKQAQDSAWFRQVGSRAVEVVGMIKTGSSDV
ncbi:MAG: glycoside hydrolase family protein [Gallionellaceae bacterium]